jgi:Zn-dependent peptidase ImmA (M78 family)
MSHLVELRRIAPNRALDPAELFNVAELQANRLLELAEVHGPPVPTSVIRDMPAVKVDQWRAVPVSGSSHWTGSSWMIVLNADEPWSRRRFTLAHELAHILAHPGRDVLYRNAGKQCGESFEEVVADHFAACLLMPKAWVRRAVSSEGLANVEDLASLFEVSRSAMRRRLAWLGMLEELQVKEQR